MKVIMTVIMMTMTRTAFATSFHSTLAPDA